MDDEGWSKFKKFTNARIGLGRAGTSLRTASLLEFKKGHAMARDAVHIPMDEIQLLNDLKLFDIPSMLVFSNAADRTTYLQRPDLGRSLKENSRNGLTALNLKPNDVCLIIADGLSAIAIHRHAIPFLNIFLNKTDKEFSIGSIIVAKQSRVALGDEIGQLTNAKIVVMLIGERPGLSSPDSMGIYMTYQPMQGLTDERRNCISNIHGYGLSYDLASDKLIFLMREALLRKLSGVLLKENSIHLQP